MIRKCPSKLMPALLITLFLWAQSAVALHDMEHASHEPVESCQIFISADHAKAMVADITSMELPATIVQTLSSYCYSSSKRAAFTADARAPPSS